MNKKIIYTKRRIKKVAITLELLNEFFLGKKIHLKVENPLPKDAKIIQCAYDINTNAVIAIIQSKEFEEIREFEVVPNYIIVVTEIRD